MNTKELKEYIKEGKINSSLSELYGEENIASAQERYLSAISEFEALFGEREGVRILSVPGRSEVSGNHTDHNNGCVLAASIDLDIIAIAAPTSDGVIKLKSQGFDLDTVVIEKREEYKKTLFSSAALIAGVCDGFINCGYNIGGFEAYTTSNVFKGSGLSSSAAFEVMIGNIERHLYKNDISDIEIAKIAQYAENEFFGKPCGLMDQTACAVGGFIAIDFKDPKAPIVTKPDFDLSKYGYSLCIVNTGGNHADLNEDYASVPHEMKSVAKALGKPLLRELSKNDLLANIESLRSSCGDRAILRAIHYFNENERVAKAAKALENRDIKEFFSCINNSGASSFKYLQNVYTTKNIEEQGLSLALAITEDYLATLDRPSAARVHGGGFAGTIQAFVPTDAAQEYRTLIESVFGKSACYILKIRLKGAIAVV